MCRHSDLEELDKASATDPGVVAAETPLLAVGGADAAGPAAAANRVQHPPLVVAPALAHARPRSRSSCSRSGTC